MNLYDIRRAFAPGTGKTIFDLALRVTFYARVSTDKDEQLHSLSAQVSYYSDYIKKNPNWTYVDGYIDEGLSGTSVNKRDNFKRMIEGARLGKFDLILTKEISRFSRNTLDSLNYTQELLRYGVGVYFQSDNINTLEPDSELRLTLMVSIAQDEVRKISERVRFGFARSIENGVVLGNSKIWGYEKDNGKLRVVQTEADMVRSIFDLYANHKMGIRGICDWLTEQGYRNTRGNSFSFSTIRGILSNPKYKGFYCGNKSHTFDYRLTERKYMDENEWVMYKDEDTVPPIVSEELWEKANKLLKARGDKMKSPDKTSYQNKYAYSGKIICMEHQVPYHRALYKYKSGNKEVWQCKEYAAKGKKGCTSPVLYTTELDEVLRQALDQIAVDKDKIIHDLVQMYSEILSQSTIKTDMARLRVEVDALNAKKEKLLDLSLDGRLSNEEFEKRNNQYNQEMEARQKQIQILEEEEVKNQDIAKMIKILRDVITQELNFEHGLDGNLIDALIDRIEVFLTDREKVFRLKVYFKILGNPIEFLEYEVKRGGKVASVCSIPHT